MVHYLTLAYDQTFRNISTSKYAETIMLLGVQIGANSEFADGRYPKVEVRNM